MPPDPSTGPRARIPVPPARALSAMYFAYFGVMGVILPYFNLYLKHLGLTGGEIGAVSGVRSGAVIVVPLLWAAVADRMHARRSLFILANFLSTGFFALYFAADAFVPLMLVTALYCFFYAPIIGFMEAYSMEILAGEQNRYGQIRVWGSVAFILVVLLLGRLVTSVPIRVILWIILADSASQVVFSLAMPPPASRMVKARASLFSHFLKPRVLVFLFTAFLMLASHGAYYGFFSIYLEDLGFSRAFIGLAWALASTAEILVMVGSSRIFSRFSPVPVMLVALAASAIRWGLLGVVHTGPEFLLLQPLHALTYAAFHVASIVYVEALISPEARTMGQSVNNAVTYGAGLTVGFLVSGWIVDAAGVRAAFFAASGMALAGLALFWGYTLFSKKQGNGNVSQQ